MPFAVEDFQDLIRILEVKPEWRADLRRLVLTNELLALPEEVARLRADTDRRLQELTVQVTALSEAQKRTEAQVLVLIEAQNRTDAQIATLTEAVRDLTSDMRAMKVDLGDLKGDSLERRHREKAPMYFGCLLRRLHALSVEELAELLEDAVERGQLTDEEHDEAILTDVVVRGRYKETGAQVYLAVEVSWGVGPHDVERAVRRAVILGKLGLPALPVVAGKSFTEHAQRLAHAQQVAQIADGRLVSAESAAQPSA